jgi:hypothetical protein
MERYELKPPSHYVSRFDGSPKLFRACWRQYRACLNGSIADPDTDDAVIDWLELIARTKVNDIKSVFWLTR